MGDERDFEIKIKATYDGTGAQQFREDLKKNEEATTAAATKQINMAQAMADQKSAAAYLAGNVPEKGSEEELLASLKARTVEEEKRLVVATRRAMLEAAIAGDKEELEKLRSEQAVRQVTIQTIQAEELSEEQINVLLAEQEVLIKQANQAIAARWAEERAIAEAKQLQITQLAEQKAAEAELLREKEAQLAAEAAQAEASALAGVNMGKLRQEATTLTRELASGTVNTRTIGALLGSLGGKLMGAAMIGYLGFEAYKKYMDGVQEAVEAQVKLTKQRADAEREWQDIANSREWLEARTRIEEHIRDLVFERASKEGEARDKIDDQIKAQEALYNRLDRVAPGLVKTREEERKALDLAKERKQVLDSMPAAYDTALKALKEQLTVEEKIEEARVGAAIAQINRDERDGKKSHKQAEEDRWKWKDEQEALKNKQATQKEEAEINRDTLAIEDLKKKRAEAEENAAKRKASYEAAQKAVMDSQKAQDEYRDAEAATREARNAPQMIDTGEVNPETGATYKKPNDAYGPNLAAAEKREAEAKARLKDHEALIHALKIEEELNKDAIEDAKKRRIAEEEGVPKITMEIESKQRAAAARKELTEIERRKNEAEKVDNIRQKEIQDQREREEDLRQVRKREIENELKNPKISPERQDALHAELTGMEKAEIADKFRNRHGEGDLMKREQNAVDQEAQAARENRDREWKSKNQDLFDKGAAVAAEGAHLAAGGHFSEDREAAKVAERLRQDPLNVSIAQTMQSFADKIVSHVGSLDQKRQQEAQKFQQDMRRYIEDLIRRQETTERHISVNRN